MPAFSSLAHPPHPENNLVSFAFAQIYGKCDSGVVLAHLLIGGSNGGLGLGSGVISHHAARSAADSAKTALNGQSALLCSSLSKRGKCAQCLTCLSVGGRRIAARGHTLSDSELGGWLCSCQLVRPSGGTLEQFGSPSPEPRASTVPA